MESLLLSGKRKDIITLESIKRHLYDIWGALTVGGMTIIPNGKYSNNPHNERICKEIINEEYCDSVILKANKKEYPIYFGAKSRGDLPSSIAYGEKDEEKLILFHDKFEENCQKYLDADLKFCTFIEAELSGKNGKIFLKNQRREIYNFLKDKREKVDLDVIGKPNLDALEESVVQFGKVFSLLRTR